MFDILAKLALPLAALCLASSMAQAHEMETDRPASDHAAPADVKQLRRTLPDNEHMLLTIFLKHDQSMNNVQRRELLQQTNWREDWPVPGTEVVDHYVMMGIGQVIVLKLPPNLLREVNLALEANAWGAYQTEFYITYDLAQARAYQRAQQGER